MESEIWRLFGLSVAALFCIFQSAKCDSDPFENFQNPQFDDYYHAPGEPLSPQDFENAEKLSLTHPPSENIGRDPIEIAGLYEGDIIIQNNLKDAIRDKSSKNAIKWEGQKWKKGIVPYLISSEFNEDERSVIARAMLEFHRQTCIVFQPRKQEADYVHIAKGQGCSSPVGRIGGVQQVTLGPGCVYPGIAIHEFTHVVGFWHEQSRWDRDEHVTVYFPNIQKGMEYNFQKFSWDDTQNLSSPYDTGSIMHYGAYAFSKDRKMPTILPKNPNHKIGQRTNFSTVDVLKINRLYNCKTGGGGSSGGGSGSQPPPNRPATTPKPSQSIGKCVDSHQHCKRWAEMGECSKNPSWMQINCRLSCNQCENMCSDSNKNCKRWAENSECSKNPEYMHTYCAKSCQKCVNDPTSGNNSPSSRCEDKDRNCPSWASRGECQKNPKYMKKNCPKSCKTCVGSQAISTSEEDYENLETLGQH